MNHTNTNNNTNNHNININNYKNTKKQSSIVKLIGQYLINENLIEVSTALTKESKISLEPPCIQSLKKHIQNKNYSKAITFISPHLTREEKEAIIPQIRLYQILQMVSSKEFQTKKNKMKILKFIRKIQKDSYDKYSVLPQCASIVFGIKTKDALPLIPFQATSQSELFTYIDNVLSKSNNKRVQTVQSNQLTTSLTDLSRLSINKCLYHNCFNEEITLLRDHQCPSSLIPTTKASSIELKNEEITSIALSHSNTKFAVLCKSTLIYLFSMTLNNNNEPGQLLELRLEILFIRVWNIYLYPITSLMWDFDDTMLISCSRDKSIRIFNEKGDIKHKIDYPELISSCFLLPNNKLIVSTLDTKIYLHNIPLGINQFSFQLAIVNEICWSQYAKVVIFSCSSLKEVIVYSHDLLSEKRRIKINDTIISISVSSWDKGKFLLVNSSNQTPVLLLFDLSNGELIRKYFGHRQNSLINKCRFGGAKDNFIIAGGNKKICIWSVNRSIPIYELDFNTGNVNDVVWPGVQPYNSFMISGSSDNSITFISNKTIQKFLHVSSTGINKTLANIDDIDGNNNNNNNNNENYIMFLDNNPLNNQYFMFDDTSEVFRESNDFEINLDMFRTSRRRLNGGGHGRVEVEGEGEEEENDDDDDDDDGEDGEDDSESRSHSRSRNHSHSSSSSSDSNINLHTR